MTILVLLWLIAICVLWGQVLRDPVIRRWSHTPPLLVDAPTPEPQAPAPILDAPTHVHSTLWLCAPDGTLEHEVSWHREVPRTYDYAGKHYRYRTHHEDYLEFRR